MIESIYIHIPFCNKICSYCDFCKMYYNKELVDKYLNELEKEIKSIYKGEIIKTLYIGGGTPSCLNIKQLNKLLTILDNINKDKNIEYTIESNFETTTIEKLKLYKKHGINRLSFGVESINNNNLKLLERDNSKELINNIINISRKEGFKNINIDLIYAIPNETIEVLKEDINFILGLNVEHISTYSLIIENNTKLKLNKINNINQDLDYLMYKIICKEMNNNNYNHYEISNFSKEGYESRHNLVYWSNKKYYGFGLGASSYIGNKRIENTRSINKYLTSNYIKNIEVLSKKDEIEYEIILNLRKKEGINLVLFKNKYGNELKEYYDYYNLLDNNYLKEKENHLLIPEDKWYISNEIIVKFLENEL